jgi:hypothetical protein
VFTLSRPGETSSLSEMDGRALCYPASSQVAPLRKSYKDGVNCGPLCFALLPAARSTDDDDMAKADRRSATKLERMEMADS